MSAQVWPSRLFNASVVLAALFFSSYLARAEFAQQGPKLVANDAIGAANQGWSVAISSDGNTAIVGGYADNSNIGAAWVFTRLGSTWSQQGPKLTGAGESGEGGFGTSVALSADGNTALIGAPGDNFRKGAAWVFTRTGSTWTQQGGKLTGGGEIGSHAYVCTR